MGRPDIDTSDPEYKDSIEYQTWQYAGMIEQCDGHLGALMDCLEKAGRIGQYLHCLYIGQRWQLYT